MPDDVVDTQGQQTGTPGGATAPTSPASAPAAAPSAEGAQQQPGAPAPSPDGTPVAEGDWQGLMRKLESTDKQVRDRQGEIDRLRPLERQLNELGGLDAVQQQIAKAKGLLGDDPASWEQRRAEVQAQAAQAVREAPPPVAYRQPDGSSLVDYDAYLLGVKGNTAEEKANQYMAQGYPDAQARALGERDAIQITAEIATGLAKGGMPVSRAVLAQLGVQLDGGAAGQRSQDLTGLVKASDLPNLVSQAVQKARAEEREQQRAIYRRLDEGSRLIEGVAPGFLAERVPLNGTTQSRESHIEDFMESNPNASVAQAVSSLFMLDMIADSRARGRREVQEQIARGEATYSPLGGGQVIPQAQQPEVAQQIIEALEARGIGQSGATLRRDQAGYAPLVLAPRYEQ